ncbi:uncharacterized protein EV420DRAFT_1542382 [Desarmillaria tabescens]|uniref:Uncharacterized protein n=1 Tax=Armillaria tabescens TaxID=1929756 RepID=A0AA39N530_ARMTA|nr:uncharacterized protein EV420DRAFT_1542382 [Desarmillaria tabescens]KAK0458461.1 hypothetical protein EV420DRAFT_1542382 [Desarmillaria tabescens]
MSDSDSDSDNGLPQYNDRPVIATAASNSLRSLLLESWKQGDAYDLAKAVVELRLKNWEQSERGAQNKSDSLEILGLDFSRVQYHGALRENPQKDSQSIIQAIRESQTVDKGSLKDIWTWSRLPYSVRCAGLKAEAQVEGGDGSTTGARENKKARVERYDELVADADEWILKNEGHLRFLSRKAKFSPNFWRYGLLRIEDLPVVLGGGAFSILPDNTAIKITRSDVSSLPGFTVLGEKRKAAVYLQPDIQSFKSCWDAMTDNVLRGLNWDNIFVAGGLVFGTLLTPHVPSNYTDVSKADEWIASDIDLYIYGLNAKQANDKIRHVEEVYKSNLPAGSPFLVVRNSQTITFYSAWPKKRVQIVLKLVKSPREVLLNFDLDVCAAGYDGANVWMLPRFVRAMETGTSIFTMDLINGHYLGDRKVTRDPRVFKYANKGYGIRILPSYQSALSTYTSSEQTKLISRGENLFPAPLSLKDLAIKSRTWTDKCISRFLRLGHKNHPLYWENASHYGQKFQPIKTNSTVPVFTHALLESNMQRSSEPLGRSCLTGFSLFMRHVALWEEEVKGKIMIYDKYWAENTYGNGFAHSSYDDSPEYEWNESFNLEDFSASIDSFNDREIKGFTEAYESIEWSRDGPIKVSNAARVTYGASVDEALSKEKDIRIPLILKKKFVDFVNTMVLKALEEAGIKGSLPLLETVGTNDSDEERAFMWRLNDILNWQMIDRRIDEIREMLWAFHRGNDQAQYEERIYHVMEQISKRAIRTSVEEEMEAFVIWVGRKPYHLDSKINAHFIVADLHRMKLSDSGEDDE